MHRIWKRAIPLAAGVALLITIFTIPALAQSGAGRGKRGGAKAERLMDRRMEQLKSQLELSDDQVTKLRPIMEENAKKLLEIRNSSERPSPEALRKLREEHRAKVAEILTPEQMKKFDQMQEDTRDRLRDRAKRKRNQ